MKRFLVPLERTLTWVETALLFSCLAVMVGVVFAETALRYFFESSLGWSHELALYLMIWTVCLGASAATKNGRHMAVDAVRRILPGKARRVLALAVSLLSAGLCLGMAWLGWVFAMSIREAGDLTVALNAPKWIVFLAMPIAGLLMSFRFLILAVDPPPETEENL